MKCCRCNGKGYTLARLRYKAGKRKRQQCGRCQRTGVEPEVKPLYCEVRVARQLGRPVPAGFELGVSAPSAVVAA